MSEALVAKLRHDLEHCRAETTRLYADLAALTRQVADTQSKLVEVLALLDTAVRRIGQTS